LGKLAYLHINEGQEQNAEGELFFSLRFLFPFHDYQHEVVHFLALLEYKDIRQEFPLSRVEAANRTSRIEHSDSVILKQLQHQPLSTLKTSDVSISKYSNLEILFVLWYFDKVLRIAAHANLLVLERHGRLDCPTAIEFLVETVDRRVPVYVDAIDLGVQFRPFHLVEIVAVAAH
jgi:hypothetical protein